MFPSPIIKFQGFLEERWKYPVLHDKNNFNQIICLFCPLRFISVIIFSHFSDQWHVRTSVTTIFSFLLFLQLDQILWDIWHNQWIKFDLSAYNRTEPNLFSWRSPCYGPLSRQLRGCSWPSCYFSCCWSWSVAHSCWPLPPTGDTVGKSWSSLWHHVGPDSRKKTI